MAALPAPPVSPLFGRALGWRRLAVAVAGTVLLLSVLLPLWIGNQLAVVGRVAGAAVVALFAFAALERWPTTLQARVPRWLLQVAAVAVAVPGLLWIMQVLATPADAPYFWYVHARRLDFVILACSCTLLAVVLALLAAVSRREVDTRSHAPVAEPARGAIANGAPAARPPSVTPEPLRWIRAAIGDTLRLIAVEQVDYFKVGEGYTHVAWRADDGRPSEALVRTPLRTLLAQLDPQQFVQVHRAVVVNLRAISHVTRGPADAADIHLRGRREVLPVSRRYLHRFRQM